MKHSIVLRTEPTVRQTEKVLARIERELTARGITTKREGPGRLRFRVPPPWKAPKPSALLAITKGAVRVSAGAGEPRQVRYELEFARLAGLAVVLSIVLLAIGLAWPRRSLIGSLGVVWALIFGVPWAFAASRFHRMMAHAARDVIERRTAPRSASHTPTSLETTAESSLGISGESATPPREDGAAGGPDDAPAATTERERRGGEPGAGGTTGG